LNQPEVFILPKRNHRADQTPKCFSYSCALILAEQEVCAKYSELINGIRSCLSSAGIPCAKGIGILNRAPLWRKFPVTVPALKHEILDYLAHAPNAGDTVQGIAEWWLLEQRIRHTVAEVRRALEELVAEGLVKTIRHADGRTHYLVRRDRLKNIRAVLQPKCQPADRGQVQNQDKTRNHQL
jgi:hypothetical protein